MLMGAILSMLSLAIIKNNKNIWEISSMFILAMWGTIAMIYPLTDFIYIVSKIFMLDSMSLLMSSLLMWVMPMMILASYKLKNNKNSNFFIKIIISLLTVLMFCFLMNNLLLFYIAFEASLIPTMCLIILWGNQSERKLASFYIMLYTVTSSLPMLLAIIKLGTVNYHMSLFLMSFALPVMMNYPLSWIMLMMAFLVKLPLFSFHMWLPKAHVEAPVAGSMVLAAILLKLGGYGMMRMNKLISQQLTYKTYIIISISMIGAIITNMMCLRQTDLKALIAYSSVGHMSLLIMSVLSNSKLGQYSSMLIMLTHGLISSCLFILSNIMYEKVNSRNILMMGGEMNISPMNSLAWIIVVSMNMALPPSMSFISEVTAMMSSLLVMDSMIILLMIINFISTTYSLYLYSMINHGNQLKLMTLSMSMSSIKMINISIHLWPLMLFTILPMKLMSWC